ncbi:calcium/sodium antiporter [Pikeienuella piscinae]|uniref:Calcium/sodium antiporter n=1 Tax=Pikeienuella piscinae TaxID=2748098 RepID=A0A7L5BUV0_9RHOB|nr:calcium/sodium antiporter [Pikeienuella piscinae]QIE55585.1 calcium/sodium antiporter [Pikeienuella piscinae]
MLIDLSLVFAGLALLVFAGDVLVKGAVSLSLRLGVPALVVSLTVVAFGTSAPELLVSIEATLDGATDLVFGNIVGSNIANVYLVLGIPALIAPIAVSQNGVMRNFVLMITASLLLLAVCGYGGLYFWTGIAFLSLLCAVLYDTYLMAMNGKVALDLEEMAPDCLSGPKIAGCIAAGVIGLPIGAHMLIAGAQSVAITMGVSEAAIGLTLVAVGTSLPELATTVMAALRRHADVAIGNVIGSNMFNILGVFGAAALVGDLPTPPGFLELDLWIMLGSSLILAPFIIMRREIGRIAGLAFIAAYVVYCVLALGPRM